MRGSRNVTIDPLAPAPAVESPQINEVLSLKTGKVWDARRLICSMRYEDLVRFRGRLLEAIQAGKPRLTCSMCPTPVYLVASTRKAFFFRHRHEDGSCPAVTRNALSQDEVRAYQYAGVQESEAHRRYKRLLLRSIGADPDFHELAEEKTWRGTEDVRRLRRPDVCCILGDLRIAFEVQLSTTFLSVVVGRRGFYRTEGALLVWVLARFDPSDRRMTEDDIIFPNNSNVLVVDEESTAASEGAGRLMVKCWHRCVEADHAQPSRWTMRMVEFNRLTLDLDGQRAFLVDVEAEERRAREALAAERLLRREKRDEELRSAFLSYWLGRHDSHVSFDKREHDWALLGEQFAARGLSIPPYTWGDSELDRLLKVGLTAKTGAPVGWGYKTLPEVAHYLHDKYPGLLFLFGRLLKLYGHQDSLREQDRTGAWSRKAQNVRLEVQGGGRRYVQTFAWPELLAYLFPEAAEHFTPHEAKTLAA